MKYAHQIAVGRMNHELKQYWVISVYLVNPSFLLNTSVYKVHSNALLFSGGVESDLT